MLQAVTAHLSRSSSSNAVCIFLNSGKKSFTSFLHFWTQPLIKALTFRTNGQDQSTWDVVSGSYRQNSHVASIRTFLWHWLFLVGRQLQHALHMKVRTFRGTFSFQTIPHVALCSRVEECSAQPADFSLRATRYADLTENFCVLFSVHVRVSCESRWLSGSANISANVLWVTVATSLPLSHCLVPWLI